MRLSGLLKFLAERLIHLIERLIYAHIHISQSLLLLVLVFCKFLNALAKRLYLILSLFDKFLTSLRSLFYVGLLTITVVL